MKRGRLQEPTLMHLSLLQSTRLVLGLPCILAAIRPAPWVVAGLFREMEKDNIICSHSTLGIWEQQHTLRIPITMIQVHFYAMLCILNNHLKMQNIF